MTITRIIVSITSFSIALIAGFITGTNIRPINNSITYSMEANTMPGVPIPNNNQFNLLVIGVDNAKRPDARLLSVWLLAYPNNSTKVTFIPVFPATDYPVRNLLLAESFHLHHGKPSQNFWDLMRDTDTWWMGYIVSDKKDLIKLVDSLGGITIDQRQFNGSQVIEFIPSWKSDPQKALEQQKNVFEGVCKQLAAEKMPKALATPEKFLKLLRLSAATKSSISQWMSQITANQRLSCYFPTFVDTSKSPTASVP